MQKSLFRRKLFDACAVESGTNGFSRRVHLFEFFVGEVDFKNAHNAIGANHAGHRERNVGNAVFAFHNRGAGQNRMFVVEDGLNETNSRHRDAGVGEALAIDNVVSNLDEFLLDFLFVKGFGVTEIFVEFFEREACATGSRPGDKCRVAVFAEDVAVNVFRVDFVFIGENAAEAVSFEHGAGAENQIARIADFISNSADDVSRNVERVGDEDNDGFFGVLGNGAEDRVHDFGVGAGKFQSVGSFARTNRRTRADDNDIGSRARAVVAGGAEFDIGAVNASGRVAGVGRFAPSFVLIEIDQNDFRCELEISEFVDDCRADV